MSQLGRFESITNIEDITSHLKKYGIAIVNGFLSEQEIIELRELFHKCFETADPGIVKKHRHPVNEAGKVVRIKRERLSDSFKGIRDTFGSSSMGKILDKYYAPNTSLLNDDIFLTHEQASDKNILPWHFDRRQSLKFFIYLTDTNKQNGAFEYCPGSHMEGHFRANYYVLRGYSIKDIPNDIPEGEIRNPQVISAKAGDLIIFDADGFHRGGVVSQGNERLVIRGHSHPMPNKGYQTKLFSKEWWLQTPFNMGKLFGSGVGRILGKNSKSLALKTRVDFYQEL